jgi:hypothetical protein
MRDGAFPFRGGRSLLNVSARGGSLPCRTHHLFLFRVRAAFLAAREREAALRFFAAARACRDKARCEAAERGCRFNARFTARERLAEGFAFRPRPFLRSRFACFRVRADALPFFGGGSFTPARRAFDRPIAIACFVDAAPCFPSRMCSISSRTNSPACVEGDLPSASSLRARFKVSSSGITKMFREEKWVWM